MNKSTNNKKNYGTAYYAMAFLAAFFFEFYWIMTNPYEYFMLIGIGVIMIIMGYLTIDSIIKATADADALRNEQNDMMLKAQKAIYIATKKNAKEAETSQIRSIKAMEIMMNKMISSQQALLEDKNAGKDDMTSLIDQLSASNAKLAKEVQSAITVNQLVKANADLVKNVKEALNASAMSASSAADLSSYVNEVVNTTPTPTPVVTPEPVVVPEPIITPEPMVENIKMEIPTLDIPEIELPEIESPAMDIPEIEIPVMEASEDEVPVMEAPELDMSELEIPDLDISDIEIPNMDNLAKELNELDETPSPIDSDTFAAMENEINMAEMAASEALEDMIIPDEMTPELEEAMEVADTDDIVIEPESPFTMPADDNPNKQLTEEEIAALFASL